MGRRIGRVQFAVYAAESLVEAVGANATLGDYPWIGWDERMDNRWFDGWLTANAPGAQIVCAGLGVHFMACFEGDALPGLVRISDVDPALSHHLWLLTLCLLYTSPSPRDA